MNNTVYLLLEILLRSFLSLSKEDTVGNTEAEISDVEDLWLKFNDLQVSEANQTTVMQDAIGGSGTSTAYYLIYMETDMFRELQKSFLPDSDSDLPFVTTDVIRVYCFHPRDLFHMPSCLSVSF